MSDPDKDLPPGSDSFGRNLGRVTGRFVWFLIPVIIVALLIWAMR